MSKASLLKRELRATMKQRLELIDPSQLEVGAQRLAAELEKLGLSGTVASYCGVGRELDPSAFNERWLARGGALVLPRVVRGETLLRLYRVRQLEELVVGYAGIREPDPARCEEVDPTTVDAILVPGLGFTFEGLRLGRGGGFYDRLLPRLRPDARRLGVAWHVQMLPRVALPVEEHDARLDGVVVVVLGC
jgi:5-formyltetrahydrofolate cyclo-ligase